MARFELVIFDNDGVLVDSEPIANQVLADLLTGYGWPTTFQDSVNTYLGGTLQHVRDLVEPQLGRPLPADFEDQYHERLFARIETELTAVPGVADALDRIDLPTCVASSGSHPRIERTLKTVGLYDRFAGRIFSADDVTRGKPFPDLFLYAAEQSGSAPDRCVVIEDSPYGVAAGKAAGMTVIGYAGVTPADRLQDADVIIAAMTELLPELDRLASR
ncbi:HAD family hydrolase [Microlunatus speluncae]|uniref:HAD family hydrolase n=1 Tax=Microlunatus speluncae TaxID=2594267 RepID=UPI0012667E9B|nr:HAD family hydrolase [Microlunatus speluncae]